MSDSEILGTGQGPLSGLIVADFSRILAGPYATMLLGDMGATVIKVEGPSGDDTRTWMPPVTSDGVSTYYLGINRNKRSIVLDLKDETDLEVARELIRRADVMIENFRPGQLARFKLSFEDLRLLNPRLVLASISGFGTEGKGKDLLGYDLMIQAMSGLISMTGEPDGPGYRAGVSVCDIVAGLHCAMVILAALRARDQTGQGQQVEVSLLISTLSAMANHSAGVLNSASVPFRMGNAHPSLAPYEPFPTRNGQLIVIAANDGQFGVLASVLGIPELANDPRFKENKARTANRKELVAALSDVLCQRDSEEWFEVLNAAGVPSAPILTIDQGIEFADQVGLDPVVEVPDGDQLRRFIRHPIGFSETPTERPSPPPAKGQDSNAIRSWLGFRN